MKKHILTATFVLLTLSCAVSAQSLRGSYFFETSLQRGKLNAAFAPQNNYVSVPLIGSVGSDAVSNVGLANFIFPSGNAPYTFMHENVPASTFLGGLPEADPYLRARTEIDLLGGGFRVGERGYVTVALSAAAETEAIVPNEFLRFAKTGANGSYPGPRVNAFSYGIFSAGFSYDLGQLVEGLRIGGRIKLLGGLFAGELDLRQINLQLKSDKVAVSTDGGGYLAGLTWADKKIRLSENKGLNGFGVAADLGFEYRLKLDGFINGVNLSASVNNLGTLSFNKNVTQLWTGATASFAGLNGINADYDFKTNLDRVVEDFSRLADIHNAEADGYSHVLEPTIYAGVEVPFLNEMVSAGLLYYRSMGFNHLMASANVSPVRWLNIGLNGTFLGAVNTYGVYAEFIPKKWVGVFIGLNKATLKTNRQLIPIENFTESGCFGVNVVF